MSDTASIKEVFNELFDHLERLETQSAAILQFLKEKKRVTDKQLAPYLEQAGNASNVKWRAARVRIERLLSAEDEEEKAEAKTDKKPEIAKAEQEQSAKKPEEQKRLQNREQPAKEQVASPELEAAIQGNVQPKPAQKKGAGEKDQSSEHQTSDRKTSDRETSTRKTIAASDKREESTDQQKRASDQTTQAKSQQEPKHEEANHPTEMTAPQAQREAATPAADLPQEKKTGEEAA
jgi:hypothetical protein